MQFNNTSSSQTVVSGMSPLPDLYNAQLHLTQPSNTQNNFVANLGMQFNSVPWIVPPIHPSVGMNSNLTQMTVNNAGNMTVNPGSTPPNPTQYQFVPTSMPVSYFPFAQQAYFQPNLVPQFCFPGGENKILSVPSNPTRVPNATTPPAMPTIPAPAGYVANMTGMQVDSGQLLPGLQPIQLQTSPDWKSDPAQTPVPHVYAIPDYSQPGTYYYKTPEGVMVELSNPKSYELPTDASSEATTVRTPSRSVDSEDSAMRAVLENQINGATIQNFGNPAMQLISVEQQQQQQSNIQHTNQNFCIQMNSLPQQNQNVAFQLPFPQQEAPAMLPQNNFSEMSAQQKNSQRDHSGSMMNRSPPGFLEGYKTHRVQNIARENLNQHSNNYENQAQIYSSRTSDDVRRSNGPQNRCQDRKRNTEYGRRSRNNLTSQPVPMVNTARQNKRPRKERQGGNKNTKRRPKRYGYRTKQDKIENVYARVTEYFSNQGVLVPEDHGVRGETVARVHIKKWLSLVKIEEAIVLVEADPRINTVRVSAPVSMKNQYQKKGFLIYWETETVEGLNHLMTHFKSYNEKDEDGSWKMDEFQKIGVALQNDETKFPNAVINEQETSPSVETIVPKASLASLNTCFATPNYYNPEAQVPFIKSTNSKPVFIPLNKTFPAAPNNIVVKKPSIPDSEKLAFDNQEDAFAQDKFGEIVAPMIGKIASSCSVCSIGA